MNSNHKIQFFDDRRDIIVPGDTAETIVFCTEHFIHVITEAQRKNGKATVALSGGSTPKAIFQKLASQEYRKRINWEKLLIFWSDERNVPADHPDSNYKMAMDAGFASLGIPKENIFRMHAEAQNLETAASQYEQQIKQNVPDASFDLIMLGMGEDGHTASLFPKTHGLHVGERLVISNFIPQKDTWRMSFTFDCINEAHHIAIYVLGKSKATMVDKVLNGPYQPDLLPIQRVGTRHHKALWIMDVEAAQL